MKSAELIFMKRFCCPGILISACCLAGLVPSAQAQPELYGDPDSGRLIRIPPDADDWTRHFRIGALVGLNINASFHRRGTFGISGNDPSKGLYDDGYVLTDQTGNAGGYTGYWGYENASQYDAATKTLSMHAASTFSTSGGGSSGNEAFPGFELAYGGNLWYWKHARVGWELGFGLLPISISQNLNSPATINQTTYNFSTGDLVMPEAPYHGGSSGQGPLIPGSPSSQTQQAMTGGTVSGSQSLNVNLYTIRLGPSFYWDLSPSFGMSLGAGPALGIVSGEYSYNEIITYGGVSTRNHGQIDSTEVIYGGYVNGTVMYHIEDDTHNADIYLGVQYMPMQDAKIGGGGRGGKLNLGGQIYLSAGINWPF